MFDFRGQIPVLLFCSLLWPLFAMAEDVVVLDMATAERLALDRDPVVAQLSASADAQRDRAVADGQLPDPQLKLGAMNLPLDSFDRGQEPMTQLQVGLSQSFPPGDTLARRSLRGQALAEAGDARARDREARVLQELRSAYLELWYQQRGADIIAESRGLFQQLQEVTRSHYASGRSNQQDVLRAGVELALLDDREIRFATAIDTARATLARWIGEDMAARPLSSSMPILPEPPCLDELRSGLLQHPRLQVEDNEVAATDQSVAESRASYQPGWMLDLTYGDRTGRNSNGTERADFLSAMVSMNLPLFTDKRQDRRLAASQQQARAARYQREDRLLDLQRALEADYAQWQRLGERSLRYRDVVLPEAGQNSQSSLQAYQSGVTDFSGLMRARLLELESRLTALRIDVERAQAQARLWYLAGEQQ